MKHVLSRLWADDCGALLVTEWVMLATILVLGLIPGLVALRNSNLSEMVDVSNATLSLDQSYEFTGQEIHSVDGIRVIDGLHGTSGTLRQGTGAGSITDIFPDGQVHKTTTGGRTGRTLVSPLHGAVHEHADQAITAGSAFIQGNHTVTGTEISTGTRRITTEAVGPEITSEIPGNPCD